MKKHFAGFVLFSFIVGVAVFVSAILSDIFPQQTVTECNFRKSYRQEKPVIKERKATNGKIDKNSPRVTQAFFNLTSKQVNLELAFKNQPDFTENDWTHIKFNYFRNGKGGVSFIHSETVSLVHASFSYENGKPTASIIGSYEWLDNLGSYESIYVTAEFTDRYESDKSTPKFDHDFAKEIVLFSGKLNRMEIIGGKNIEK